MPRALDLFCCAGGASVGLHRAGFNVIGVDIDPQPNYPFEFHQADALGYPLDGFDFIWASPPCQKFCALRTREDLSSYPDLIKPMRQRLLLHHGTLRTVPPIDRSNEPTVLYVIENVPGAPVRHDLTLCGAMFGLRSYRHRHFETNFYIQQPDHPKHAVRVNRRGENRREHWANGGFLTITGDVGTYCGPEAMGIDWMTGDEMSEAIPPAYSEYIGRAALAAIRQKQ